MRKLRHIEIEKLGFLIKRRKKFRTLFLWYKNYYESETSISCQDEIMDSSTWINQKMDKICETMVLKH